ALQNDGLQLQNVMTLAFTALRDQSSASMVAAYRIGPLVPNAPQDFSTAEGVIDPLLTAPMRELVRDNPDQQIWQQIALPRNGGTAPGIMVGQQLEIEGVASYELYLAYDLANAPQTLSFVQRTLWIVGIGLVLLISGIAWFVLRSVTTPIS